MSLPENKFRNSNNTRILKGLFYEMSTSKDTVVYTLKEHTHEGYPSLYEAYMSCNDPTEYSFSVQYLDSYEHWQMLCACNWFKPIVSNWRRDLSTRLRSEALQSIITEAKNPEAKNSYAANKFLVEKGWVDKNTKGRPSKTDIKKAAEEQASESAFVEEAYARLQTTLNIQ